MQVIKAPLEGILLLQPQVYQDERGYFVELWQKKRYDEIGINPPFVQDNHSKSLKGTLRGLHFQKKHPQGKLVMVSLGKVFDVVVDIRPKSVTFGKWYGVILSQEKQNQIWIPPGFAHGFLTLSETAHLHYKCTDFYHPNDEAIIRWDDPFIAISWPLEGEPLLSEKDAEGQYFGEIIKDFPCVM